MIGSLPRLEPSDIRAFDLLAAPVWLLEPRTVVTLWANPAGLSFWNAKSVVELRAKKLAEEMSTAARDRLSRLQAATERGERIRHFQTFYPDNRPVRVHLICRGVWWHESETPCMLIEGQPVDGTTETAGQRALEVLASIPVAATMFDPRGRVLWENPRAQALFPSIDSVRPNLRDRFSSSVDWKIGRGGPSTQDSVLEELELETVEGRRWHLVDARSMTDSFTGGPVTVVTHTDIHRFKTAELALREAKELAELANRSKDEFLANTSHEIRTPMNGVLGTLELLGRSNLDAEQRRLTATIGRSARTLLQILNDILDLSRIEAGKVHLESIPFDLRETIEDVVALHRENAQHKTLDIDLRFAENAPAAVVGDPYRLSQVLGNLISNAIKFTDSGTVTVELDIIEDADDEVVARLTVADTGRGVTLADQARIFSAFEQADGSITRQYGGTGLGLTISRRLVALMGGHLGLQSTPGRGSRFWFSVRLSIPRASGETLDIQPIEDLQGLKVGLLAQGSTASDLHAALLTLGLEVLRFEDRTHLRAAQTQTDLPQVWIISLDAIEAGGLPKKGPLGEPLLIGWAPTPRPRPENIDALLIGPTNPEALFACLSRLLGLRADHPPWTAPLNPKLEGFRVLLVEDNLINQEVACGMLEVLGCRTTCVANGALAIEALAGAAFDAVLMDCQMPVLDGYSATRLLREREAKTHTHTPVIALTANAMAGDRDRCLEAGMDDFLAKPFELADLAGKLSAWLGPKQQKPEVP